MTLFALYNEDGSIHQANKVYDPTGYDTILNDLGHAFVAEEKSGPLSPNHWMVDIKSKSLSERPLMNIQVSKTTIKCGANDSAVFTGCPAGATFNITTSNISVYSGKLDATELEISIPMPCIYRVSFDCWPFKTFTQDIEAVA